MCEISKNADQHAARCRRRGMTRSAGGCVGPRVSRAGQLRAPPPPAPSPRASRLRVIAMRLRHARYLVHQPHLRGRFALGRCPCPPAHGRPCCRKASGMMMRRLRRAFLQVVNVQRKNMSRARGGPSRARSRRSSSRPPGPRSPRRSRATRRRRCPRDPRSPDGRRRCPPGRRRFDRSRRGSHRRR
jgi:hypothetical protein